LKWRRIFCYSVWATSSEGCLSERASPANSAGYLLPPSQLDHACSIASSS
jgi:hypothetical protein